jgi:hypothetical protein
MVGLRAERSGEGAPSSTPGVTDAFLQMCFCVEPSQHASAWQAPVAAARTSASWSSPRAAGRMTCHFPAPQCNRDVTGRPPAGWSAAGHTFPFVGKCPDGSRSSPAWFACHTRLVRLPHPALAEEFRSVDRADPAALRRWFDDHKYMAANDHARVARVCLRTVRRWRDAAGVAGRPRQSPPSAGPRPRPPLVTPPDWRQGTWLEDQYTAGCGIRAIARLIARSYTATRRHLRRRGVVFRQPRDAARPRHPCCNRPWLLRRYVVEGLSLTRCARLAGVPWAACRINSAKALGHAAGSACRERRLPGLQCRQGRVPVRVPVGRGAEVDGREIRVAAGGALISWGRADPSPGGRACASASAGDVGCLPQAVSCAGRCDLRASHHDANLRRCVRPTRATNIVLSALVDVSDARKRAKTDARPGSCRAGWALVSSEP